MGPPEGRSPAGRRFPSPAPPLLVHTPPPTTHHPPPTTHHQPLTTNHQPPITHHLPPPTTHQLTHPTQPPLHPLPTSNTRRITPYLLAQTASSSGDTSRHPLCTPPHSQCTPPYSLRTPPHSLVVTPSPRRPPSPPGHTKSKSGALRNAQPHVRAPLHPPPPNNSSTPLHTPAHPSPHTTPPHPSTPRMHQH